MSRPLNLVPDGSPFIHYVLWSLASGLLLKAFGSHLSLLLVNSTFVTGVVRVESWDPGTVPLPPSVAGNLSVHSGSEAGACLGVS